MMTKWAVAAEAESLLVYPVTVVYALGAGIPLVCCMLDGMNEAMGNQRSPPVLLLARNCSPGARSEETAARAGVRYMAHEVRGCTRQRARHQE